MKLGDTFRVVSGLFKGFTGIVVDFAEASRVSGGCVKAEDSPDGLWLKAYVFGRDTIIPNEHWRGQIRQSPLDEKPEEKL